MNGIISYRIGFYTSLLPADSGAPPEVTKLLQDCEQQAANDGLVVFAWTKGGPNRKGLLLEGREEALVRFKKLAEITAEHKLAWRVMDPSNTAGPAWELWNQHIGRLPFIAQQALVNGSLLAAARARYGVGFRANAEVWVSGAGGDRGYKGQREDDREGDDGG